MEKYLNILLIFTLAVLILAITFLLTSTFFDWPKTLGGC